MWSNVADLTNDHPPYRAELLIVTVKDSNNADDTHGCFFLLRAEQGVDIGPKEYSFFVAEKGNLWVELDLDYRYYDRNQTPYGGDQNYTYPPPFTEEEPYWTEMEYIGFDMPTEDMDISIVDGNTYEVMIRNTKGEVVFRDDFVYTCQGEL